MNKVYLSLMIVVLAVVLVGCEKKAKVEEMPMEMEIASEDMIASPEETTAAEDLASDIESAALSEGDQIIADATLAVPSGNSGPTGNFSNVSIADIQKALQNANLYTGTVDGVNGKKTKQAVKEFQAQNSLTVDGKVGPKTWKKLEPYLYNAMQTANVPVSPNNQ